MRMGVRLSAMILFFAALPLRLVSAGEWGGISVADYPSIQAAIDANPGQMIHVPSGRHVIQTALRIATNETGLFGHGTIVQENPESPILLVDRVRDVRIESLTFTRSEEKRNATADGILCRHSQRVTMSGVRVLDNRSQAAAVRFESCKDSSLLASTIINYKTIGIDDRSANPLLGYAFRCIDGTGIVITGSQGLSITDNQVVEEALLPTREVMEKHKLGALIEGRHPTKLGELGRHAVDGDRVNNWHQGSGIVATSPTETSHLLIRGNRIDNAAQGIDLHCDQSIISNNIIRRCMIGLKATHGCRNLILSDNLITHADLWGIVINPGASSSAGQVANGDVPATPVNVDAGIIIAQNIISDYGEGNEYWNWGGRHDDRGSSYAIAFLERQLPANPLLRDILVQGNIVYDTSRDQPVGMPDAQKAQPKYRYAVYVEKNSAQPGGIRFVDNILNPGMSGISNAPIESMRNGAVN